MALGLFLILIVVLPTCIYLYIDNKKLKEEIISLKEEKKTILERKISLVNEQIIEKNTLNTTPIDLSKEKNEFHVIKDINCRSGVPIIKRNNPITKEEEQEKDAIISYEELMKKKEKDNNPSETEQFLQSLKDLRNNLKDKKQY